MLIGPRVTKNKRDRHGGLTNSTNSTNSPNYPVLDISGRGQSSQLYLHAKAPSDGQLGISCECAFEVFAIHNQPSPRQF